MLVLNEVFELCSQFIEIFIEDFFVSFDDKANGAIRLVSDPASDVVLLSEVVGGDAEPHPLDSTDK